MTAITKPALAVLPSDFRRFPTEGGPLHGEVVVDLGRWVIDGRVERVVMRVAGHKLQSLVDELAATKFRDKVFADGLCHAFVVATEF